MMCLPYRVSETEYSVFIVLEKENIDRMRLHDPAAVMLEKMGAPWSALRMRELTIAYANPQEAATFTEIVKTGEPIKAMQFLARGFRYRPEEGDHDGAFETIAEGGKS